MTSHDDKHCTPERPSVPNPCSVCGVHIFGSFIGTGDGSMKDGGSFAHPECYWRDQARIWEQRCHEEEKNATQHYTDLIALRASIPSHEQRIHEGRGSQPAGALVSGSPHLAAREANPGSAVPGGVDRHERRVVGHASGWQEQMDTCVCGKPWPCASAASATPRSDDAQLEAVARTAARSARSMAIEDCAKIIDRKGQALTDEYCHGDAGPDGYTWTNKEAEWQVILLGELADEMRRADGGVK